MPSDDSKRNDDEREKRIEALKRQASELVGAKMIGGEKGTCPPEVEEQFWEHVVAYEKAPWTTNFKQLEDAGMQLPAPETLDDQALTAKLWELIGRLAFMRVFLENTDHLSDRALYTALWSDLLREETKDLAMDEDSACHFDLVGSGSEEDTQLYLKYYADEEARRQWHSDFPDDPLPDPEDPPYDRDRFLPYADYRRPSDHSPNRHN